MDGSGTSVSDASGNGNTATFCASAPTWTSYGVKLVAGNCIQTPVKTFLTAFVHSCVSSYVQSGAAGGVPTYPTLLGIVGGADGINLMSGNTYASVQASYIPSIFANAAGSWKTTSNVLAPVCSVTAYSLGASDHTYTNGVENPYQSQGTSASVVTTTSTGYAIGIGTAAYQQEFVGSIDYVTLYPTALTSAQIAQESAYINAKVNARSGYPSYVQPAATNIAAGNLFNCIGDSLTYAQNGSNWCTSSYAPTFQTYTYANWGIGSDSANGEMEAIKARVLSTVNTRGRNICLNWFGTNDVQLMGYSVAQAWAALQKLGRDEAALGCTPIVTTMISRTGADTKKNALNALIRANWRTAFAAMDDIAAVPALGADGAYSNTNCFAGDGIHLIGPGAGSCAYSLTSYGIVGANAGKIVSVLDGSTPDSPTASASNTYVENIQDNYVLQTPTAAATNTLPDCTGLTGIVRTIYNGSASYTITVGTTNSQTVTGSSVIAAYGVGAFTCELTGASTGGNYWLRTQ